MTICLMSNSRWYENQCALEASLNKIKFLDTIIKQTRLLNACSTSLLPPLSMHYIDCVALLPLPTPTHTHPTLNSTNNPPAMWANLNSCKHISFVSTTCATKIKLAIEGCVNTMQLKILRVVVRPTELHFKGPATWPIQVYLKEQEYDQHNST